MNIRLFIFVIVAFTLSCNGKDEKETPEDVERNDSVIVGQSGPVQGYGLDASPMDMLYFPIDFPKLKMTSSDIGDPYVRIIYSRPRKGGRAIFGGLLEYGKPWRLGANESTEIQFFKPAFVNETRVNTGRYIMYCIPHDSTWTIILNSNTDSWGLQQERSRDVASFEIPVDDLSSPVEFFTMNFESEQSNQANLIMSWDARRAILPFRW